jgi:hypothetical protein
LSAESFEFCALSLCLKSRFIARGTQRVATRASAIIDTLPERSVCNLISRLSIVSR